MLFFYCFLLLAACEEPAPVVTSTLVVNAMIHNSSGSEAFHGNLRIDRGRIRTGYIADFVLFDPDTIEDELTMQDPAIIPVRVDKIWVSGVLVFDHGTVVKISDEQPLPPR